jgi:hypothetical protein
VRMWPGFIWLRIEFSGGFFPLLSVSKLHSVNCRDPSR